MLKFAVNPPALPPLPHTRAREKFREIGEQVKSVPKPAPVTVRELLGWFDAKRRGASVVQSIRSLLAEAKLVTKPDFEGAYIDGDIEFVAAEEALAAESAERLPEEEVEVAPLPIRQITADPTYRIGKLPSANTPPVSVRPQQSINEAITIMLVNRVSQLPVMEGERNVKGVISWTSIGSRLGLGVSCAEVRECMELAHVVSADISFLEAIPEIVANRHVLIRDSNNKISGIVTTSDLSLQFRLLAEPFLRLGEIENHIRRIIERGKFTREELSDCRDPSDSQRRIDNVYDLTLGEYMRLLQNPTKWTRVQLGIDRGWFIAALEKVRQIRNDVMHFDPDGIPDEDLDYLRVFTLALQQLQSILSSRNSRVV
jgi:hypothetical protein